MDTHAESVDMVYLRPKQHLLAILALEVCSYQRPLAYLAVLNYCRLFAIGHGENCTSLKVGETGAGHDDIVTVYKDAASCYIVLVAHELAINDVHLSSRKRHKGGHSLDYILREGAQ